MKIYVIAWDYRYEGYGAPQSAYSTREAAEDSIAQYSREDDPFPEIFELEVQEPKPVKSHEELLKALTSARNYSYEATMGDYSMSSINRAQDMVQEAKQALIGCRLRSPDMVAENLPLDPEPWVYKGVRRANYVITLGWEAVFKPRDGYSQNRGDYS